MRDDSFDSKFTTVFLKVHFEGEMQCWKKVGLECDWRVGLCTGFVDCSARSARFLGTIYNTRVLFQYAQNMSAIIAKHIE